MADRPLAEHLGSSGDELLAALLDSTVDAVYAVDQAGDVRFANPAALELLGYTEAELLGMPSHATIHHHRPDGTPLPEDRCPLLLPRATGEPVRVELDWFIRSDGAFVPVAYSSAPVTVGGRRGAVVVFRDVSERERAEAERRRAEAISASRARIVQAALDERRRLGRDLHDGAQQRLVNLALALRTAAAGAGDEATRAALRQATDEARAALSDLRDLAAGLHPTILTNRGLSAAVASLTARAPLPVTQRIADARYPEVVEGTVYFVIAEALANVGKHAAASEAHIDVVDDGAGWLTVTVADDGAGGAVAAGGPASGLAGLADRVAAVGGTLEVASPPGEGTRVIARVPTTPPA